MRVLIPYVSYSGNTLEVAELLEEKMIFKGYEVDKYEIGMDIGFPNLSEYDLVLLGTFTWAMGSTPNDVKDFVADVGYKPDNIEVFGTGETQFGGDEMFCAAVDKLCHFYGSKLKGLKVEQSPRGYQEHLVTRWFKEVEEVYLEREQDVKGA